MCLLLKSYLFLPTPVFRHWTNVQFLINTALKIRIHFQKTETGDSRTLPVSANFPSFCPWKEGCGQSLLNTARAPGLLSRGLGRVRLHPVSSERTGVPSPPIPHLLSSLLPFYFFFCLFKFCVGDLLQIWKQKAQYLQHKQNKAEATTVKRKAPNAEGPLKVRASSMGILSRQKKSSPTTML